MLEEEAGSTSELSIEKFQMEPKGELLAVAIPHLISPAHISDGKIAGVLILIYLGTYPMEFNTHLRHC